MSRFLFYFFIKPVSYFPFSVLHIISDFLYYLVYHLLGYRKSIVRSNLQNSFPNKSDVEKQVIEKQFYRHLCDVIVESVKLFSISEHDLRERFKITNQEMLEEWHAKNQSVILVAGHYNNWEIAGKGFGLNSPHQVVGIYSPMKDKFFDEILKKSRTEFGVEIVARGSVPRAMVSNRHRLTMTVFGADQSPTFNKQVHWMHFLNQETAVHIGTEVFASKYNYPVLFIRLNKTRRGYYEGELEVLSENPSETSPGEITELHAKSLEKMIREQPQYWLWSHKRWKRTRTSEELERAAQQ